MVGKDYKGDYLYEFIFSDTTKNIDGDEWDTFPASGRPEAPHEHLIKKVGRLESELKLDVIQNSDTFAVWDAVDGIVALGWEDIDGYDEYPESRLWFSFGLEINEVNDKLYERDLVLEYNKDKKSNKNEN